MVPPPDVKPPSETKGNRIAFLFNAYQNVAKVAVAVVASIALFIFVAPFVLGEAQLRALAQVFGVETLFVELRLIPEHDPSLLANNLPQQSEADLPPAPPNQDYFTSISEALRMGEIERSAVLMKAAPPKKLESEFDLNQVASLSARFYLAVGKDEQALRAASARCGGDGRRGEGLVSTCLPLARSYIGLGRFQEASTVLDNLEAASDAEGYATQLGFARAALKVGLDASPRALADHIFVFLQPISMDVEWERQIAKWILRDFGRIGHRRWRDVAQILLKLERAKVAEAMGRVAVESGRYSYAVGLTRFLDFLALRYGYPVLGFKHGSGRLLVNDTRVSITLQAIASNMAADERNIVGNRLQVLRGKRPFAEVERLIAVNLALQEKNWNKAFQILNGQIENIPNSRFSFEWKLAGAAFAIGSNNLGMAGQLEQALTLYGAKVPKVKEIFDYWYTLARLRLRVQRAAGDAVARASLLADSEREQGLVAALKLSNVGAREERGMGELESIVQRYPWHDSVLEAAILASGRRGQDPSRYMAMQNRLTPIRLAAGREKNLLLDTTVEELLRLL
jgi:tetratricopeptide (TPR) repeat protein